MLGDVLEGEQEAWEILIEVELFGFCGGGVVAVTLAEFLQRGELDGALEVQVQLGLGEGANEGVRRVVGGVHKV